MGITTDIIYIVLAALVGGLIAHFLRQPLIFGYILAGVIVGPYTRGVTVQHIEDIKMLAEIGIALLLFTIGLEFSFDQLKRVARISFVATPLQVLLCTVSGYFIATASGLASRDAMWFGAAISLSSTMVVLKIFEERSKLSPDIKSLGVAMLIAQDLAVVPMMLLLPQLSESEIGWGQLGLALGGAALFLTVILVLGTKFVPRLFGLISRQGAPELLFLATLGVAFGSGAIFHAMGFSFALGAFVAGMLLSETEYSQQASRDVGGLKDLFALIFFASIGMLFDPRFFAEHASTIIVMTLGVMALKACITTGIVRLFGYPIETAGVVGVGLSQVGEFAFVIAGAGSVLGRLSDHSFSLLLAVTLLSMLATPSVFGVVCLGRRKKDEQAEALASQCEKP